MSDIPPKAPSGYRVQDVLTAWHEARERMLLNDPSLEGDEEALRELLGPEEGEARDILARVLRAKVHAETMAAAADEQASLIVARKRRYQTREDNLKALAVTIMGNMGIKKVELGDLTASVVAGRASLAIPKPDLIPDIYIEFVTTRVPDKDVIRSMLDAGKEVPGAELKYGADFLMIKKG